MNKITRNRLLGGLLMFCLAFTPAAYAVVTILDPGGVPVANKTVTITLPGQEPQEGETDDRGILFWWLDGNRSKVDELPEGTLISDGYTFENSTGEGAAEESSDTGMSTTSKVLIGTGVAAAALWAINESDNNGNNNDGGGTTPPPDPNEPVISGEPVLAVSPTSLSISRTVGDPCPVSVGAVTVSNTGDGSLNFTLTPASSSVADFSYPDSGGPVSGGGSTNVSFDYDHCSPDEAGTSTQVVSIDGGTAGTEMVNLSVTTSAAPVSEGALSNTGPDSFVHVHNIGVSSCPDPVGTIMITNTGGKPIVFSIPSTDAFIALTYSTMTINPGETVSIDVIFPCSGYMIGDNNGMVSIGSNDAVDTGTDTGSVVIPVTITVNP